MTRHDLIFSDQRRIRIARHVAFWLVWCVSYNLLFHFPFHVFKGWDTTGPGTVNLQKLGVPMFFIKTLLVNSLFGVIIPQIAFTYFLIYWLIPNYFYKKKNVFVTISVISGALLVFYILALGFKQSPGIYNRMTGMRPASALVTAGACFSASPVARLASRGVVVCLKVMRFDLRAAKV